MKNKLVTCWNKLFQLVITIQLLIKANSEKRHSGMACSSKAYHSKLNSLFRCHLAYFPYYPGNHYKFGSLLWLIRLLAWPDLIYGCIKFASLTAVSSFKVAVVLGDFTWYMGSARFWYLIVCFLWTLIAHGVRTVCYISTINHRYQYWIKPMSILETTNDSKREKQFTHELCYPLPPLLIKSTFIALKSALAISYFTGWSVNIPILLFFPISCLPLTILNSINTGFHGFLAAAWEVNFSILFGFYFYYCGYRFNRLETIFLRSLKSRQSKYFETRFYERIKKKRFPSISSTNSFTLSLVQYEENILLLCKEIKKSRIFWDKTNNIIFMGTFLAETLLIYLIFFAKGVTSVMLYIMIWLGFLTIFYGQSINIIPGIYCQRQYNQCVATLFNYVSSGVPIPVDVKVKVLNTLDYLVDDKVLTVFWCLYASSWNYIKVQAEIAMLLLLLIANARS
ncbi:uncharacterized protein LOC107368560 [Tetranychus urticae]|uniref:Gustatory receptor n=1 Tax=Tetranychus urticae TaxID=32264 RepID=T1KYU3_TETUR|nr:uncharacterized protein LOC107368560 [Tetranychus urticae]